METLINSKIYLSGGGDENQSLLFDNFFFQKLNKGAKLLYIPIALKGNTSYDSAPEWMERVLTKHNRMDIELTIADNFLEESAQQLEKYDAIYIGGGNTWYLIKEMNGSGFSERLKSFLHGDKLFYGGSAGAIIMGKYISFQDDPNEVFYKDDKGLDLIQGFSLGCHYEESKRDFYQAAARSNNSKVICLPNESGVIFDMKNIEVIGEYIVFDEEG